VGSERKLRKYGEAALVFSDSEGEKREGRGGPSGGGKNRRLGRFGIPMGGGGGITEWRSNLNRGGLEGGDYTPIKNSRSACTLAPGVRAWGKKQGETDWSRSEKVT